MMDAACRACARGPCVELRPDGVELGTRDYGELSNKPRIGGVELVGDLSPGELGLTPEALGLTPEALGLDPGSLGVTPEALGEALEALLGEAPLDEGDVEDIVNA